MKYIFLMILLGMWCNELHAREGNRRISGRVTDAVNGEGIGGASLLFQGKAINSVTSDENGEFTLELHASDVLITVRMPGYQTRKFYLGDSNRLNIRLIPAGHIGRDDSWVMPLGKTDETDRLFSAGQLVLEREDLAGAISLEQVLQAKIPGLNVQMRSGMPGEGAMLSIRGNRSLHAAIQPLIVIDGMICENSHNDVSSVSGYYDNPLKYIDVNDIQQVTVLKNGTALYGAKGSGGVILIETHRPVEAKTTVQFSASAGVNLKPEILPMLDGAQHKYYLYEQMQGAGMSVEDIHNHYPWMENNPDYVYNKRYNNNTDWQKEVFRNALRHNYHLMVKGGDEVAKYALSVGYLKNNSVLKTVGYERYNTRLNADLRIVRQLSLQTNLAYLVSKGNGADDLLGGNISLLGAALRKSPLFYPRVMDHNGIVYPKPEDVDPLGFSNPEAIGNKAESGLNGNDFRGSAKLIYEISSHLQVSHLIGVNYYKVREKRFIPKWGIGGFGEDKDRLSARYLDEYLGVFNETRVSYERLFNVVHKVGLTLGVRVSNNTKEQDNARDFGLANDEFKSSSTEAAATSNIDKKFVSGINNRWNDMSYYFSADYAWKGIYYVDAAFTAEASSKFSKDNRWQYFPMVNAGIRLTSMEWLKDNSWLNELKVRVGWEKTGNEDIGCYSARGYYVPVMYKGVGALIRRNPGNPDLKPESTQQINVGLDMMAFGNRLALAVDYYNSRTKNIVLRELLQDGGSLLHVRNGGEISASGIELGVQAQVLDHVVRWNIGMNIALPRTKVEKMPGNGITEIAGGRVGWFEGKAPGVFYGWKAEGVFTSAEESAGAALTDAEGRVFQAGDMCYADVKKDGRLDESDYVVIGDLNPDFFGGLFTDISFHRFTLSVLFNFTFGNDIFNYTRMQTESMSGYANQSAAVAGRWTTEGQLTDIPRAVYGKHANQAFSSRWIEDGSYIKLKNITLAYDLRPNRILRSARFYISAENLFTRTRYLGYDPELGYSDVAYLRGVDYGKIPLSASVMLGVKIGF